MSDDTNLIAAALVDAEAARLEAKLRVSIDEQARADVAAKVQALARAALVEAVVAARSKGGPA